jgi:hypothetical protein
MFWRLALAALAQALAFAETTPEVVCGVQPVKSASGSGQWAQTAQFIAGLNAIPSGSIADERDGAWSDYSKVSGSDWRKLQKRYLDRIDAWRARALGNLAAPQVAFYPFGGPDAANLLAFYTEARTYVIVGLEPVGCIPSNVQDYTPAYFAELRSNLSSVVANGFFRTNEMGGNFKAGTVNGVLPLILYVLVRSGFGVEDVSPIGIGANGPVAAAPQTKSETAGVSIRFTDVRHGERTLTYLACNLQNSRLQRKPGTMKYLNDLPPAATLVKSASYLMHKPYFSTVRNLILAKSAVIVEDDSGIPYRYFDQSAWDVRLFGSYSDPITLFKNWRQDDLKAAFEAQTTKQPLDFGIGYRRGGESNLLVAARRTK